MNSVSLYLYFGTDWTDWVRVSVAYDARDLLALIARRRRYQNLRVPTALVYSGTFREARCSK